MNALKVTFKTGVTNERIDPTEWTEVKVVAGPVGLTFDALWDQTRTRLIVGERAWATTKGEKLVWKIINAVGQYDHYGKRFWLMGLWEKMPMNWRRALCMLRGHWWHYEEDGDAENGPGEVTSTCLRCDGFEVCEDDGFYGVMFAGREQEVCNG